MTNRQQETADHLIRLAGERLIIRGVHALAGEGPKSSLRSVIDLAIYATTNNPLGMSSAGVVTSKAGLHLGCLKVRVVDGRLENPNFTMADCVENCPERAYKLLGPSLYDRIPAAWDSKKEVVYIRYGSNWGFSDLQRTLRNTDPFFLAPVEELDRLLTPTDQHPAILGDKYEGQLDPLTILSVMRMRVHEFKSLQCYLLASITDTPWTKS